MDKDNRHINSQTDTRPSMRVPLSKKIANKFEYTKTVIDYYIGSSFFLDEIIQGYGARDLRRFYAAYNMQLPEKDFTYVTNPLNSSNPAYKNWPAKLRPYSIIRPNVDLLEGEYEKRPFNFTVKVNNSDAVNRALDEEYSLLLSSLEQQFINELNARQANTGQPSQEVELPAKLKAKFSSNYKDERAIMGEAALNIIIDDLFLEETFKRIFKDWLIAGEVYSYKGVQGKELTYERVSPLDFDFDKSPDTEYVEDGQWAVRRMWMTMADIIDNWYDELKDQDIDMIQDTTGSYSFRTASSSGFGNNRVDEDLRRSKIPVFHVTWKYLTKIGILSYPNPITGEIEQMEVPETYVPDKAAGETVEWFWINEVWEGYRIFAGLYVGIQPIPMQRNKANNFSACKLPYNGKKFSEVHADNISIVEMGIPYEELHRVLHFNMERTIAKSKGKIVLLDQNVVPRQNGWTEEKFLYWAEANGWGMINRNQIGVDRGYNQYQVLDLGLYQHIENLVEIMNFVKTEWDELLGITRQRKGKTEASETATGVSNAVYQSSVISERTFSRFEEFVQRDLLGLLDYSKLAWREGHKRLWFGDDMRSMILDISPEQYSETEFGVFVSRSPRDIQSLEIVRQQVQAFAQNGMPPSTIVDVVRARSLSKLQQILREKEVESVEAQQRAAEAENEVAEKIEMIKGQFSELQGLIDERLINIEYDRKEEIEHIKGAYSTYRNVEGTGDNNANDIPDALEVRKQFADETDKTIKRTIEQQKLAIQSRQKDRELDIKERELKVRKEIADKQAKVALKNKVAGESKKS